MKKYKIELFTSPVFDDQYRYRVYEVDYGDCATDYKETPVLSGNDTLANVKKEIDYWFSKSATDTIERLAKEYPEHYQVNHTDLSEYTR